MKRSGIKFAYATGDRPLEGYTIKRGIGVGGFGEVYFAVSDAGKEVALKRIQRNLDIELRGVSQCLNLKHPNLVALYDIRYDEGGEGWVVMEFVAGESLRDAIERSPEGMPDAEVRHWFAGLAAGVACLHGHGIVHRDLKPGNIFEDAGIVKVGDYGLAKFISVSRRSGQTESVGTFHYMAPEIGNGRYGKEVDVYALGIMLYEMVTGRVPFDGETSQEIIMKHLTAQPDLAGVPSPYREVIADALEKDPQKRLHSVQEMAARLGLAAPLGYAAGSTGIAAGAQVGAGDEIEFFPVEDAVEAGGARGGTPPSTARPPSVSNPAAETIYIGEHPEIEFGPVEDVVLAEPLRRPPSPAPVPARRPAAPVPPRSRRQDDEPVARAVQQGFCRLRQWWADVRFGTVTKFVLLLAAVLAVVINANWLVPAAVVLGLVYLTYRLIRGVVLGFETAGGSGAGLAAGDSRRQGDFFRQYLVSRPVPERAAELLGSLLMAAFVAGVVSVVLLAMALMLVGGPPLEHSLELWASKYVWMLLVTTLGAWAVLFSAKAWEGRCDAQPGRHRATAGEQVRRRFAMLVVGLLLGAAAYGLGSALMIDLGDRSWKVEGVAAEGVQGMVDAEGRPLLAAFLVYFAALFLLLRWWRQADPLRYTRLSLWTTFVGFLAALVLSLLVPFPQPWGFMLVMGISLAVQLSAPWMTPDARTALRRRWENA